MTQYLPFLTLASAVASIVGLTVGPWLLGAVCKGLTTVLILAYAWPRTGDPYGQYRWMRAGLLFSISGDVCLLWPDKGFVPGLASFLVAHLCYIRGFVLAAPLASRWQPYAFFGVLAGAMLGVLWPRLPSELYAPVLVYVLCLMSMASQSAVWALRAREEGGADWTYARWAAIGGASFLVSDGVLSFDKFMLPFPAAIAIVLTLYWWSCWCMAQSLRPRAGE